MPKRLASGKPRPGEQKNQSQILTDVVTFTGSIVVDLKRQIRSKGPGRREEVAFVVLGITFNDNGGAALVTRLSYVQNGDGTFTIFASKDSTTAGTLATATNPCTVRWSVLVTN